MIILSTLYGKLPFITTVFSPQKHIKIGIRQQQSIQGAHALYSGLLILKFWAQVPGSFVLGLILEYAEKQQEGKKKLCFVTLTNNVTLILVFLDETSEGMFLLYLLELAETAYLKVYRNYPEALFHVKKFSCSKDFRRSMVEVLQIYVCIMRK